MLIQTVASFSPLMVAHHVSGAFYRNTYSSGRITSQKIVPGGTDGDNYNKLLYPQ